MRVLTLENNTYDLDTVPEEIEEDLQFWVLEYSNNEENTDYYSKPLLFMEKFSDIRLDIRIGPYHFNMPKSWSILCADKFHGDAELIQPTTPGFNERDFCAFAFNPMTGFRPEYLRVEVMSLLPETLWFMPKLKFGQLLVAPLTIEENPPCIFITHQKNNKVPEVLNLEYLV